MLPEDKIITSREHYDSLHKELKELKEELDKRKVDVRFTYGQTSSYIGYKNTYNYRNHTFDFNMGAAIPTEIMECFQKIKEEMVEEEKRINEISTDLQKNSYKITRTLIDREENNEKLLRDIETNRGDFEKKIKNLPGWVKWLWNINYEK